MSRLSLRYVLAFAAACLVGASSFAPPTAAADERPFVARLTGNASLSPTDDPCVMRNDETGAGHSTYLRQFTFSSVEFVDFCAVPNGVTVEATFTMTAASGDQLFGEYVTIGVVNADGNLDILGLFRITGGTGRFDDASGGGLLQATAFFAPGLPFEGSFLGVIDF